MGNVFQRIFEQGCINQCFGRRYQQWKQSLEFDGFDFRLRLASTSSRDLIRRNRIAEYISWALNRSRSPLLLDDALASTPVEVNSNEFGGVNSVSWISDAAASDASHAMYREMDPYNYSSIASSLIPSPTSSVADPGEPGREGAWVAVTKLTNSKNQTVTTAMFVPGSQQDVNAPVLPQQTADTVPHCDEEVDGLELARLARNLWPNTKSNRRSTDAVIAPTVKTQQRNPTSNSLHGFDAKHPSSTAVRPQDLNIRHPRQPGQLFKMEDPLRSNPGRSDTESPIELDWDHEPGTVSPPRRKKPLTRPIPATLTRTNEHNGLQPENDGFTEVSLFPVRPRRHPRPVVSRPAYPGENVSPLDGDTSLRPKRWSCSDKLLTTTHRLHPTVPNKTSIPCSNLFASPDETSTRPYPPSDDLFDSGFAGLSQSIVDGDSDGCGIGGGGGRLTDFLWEHETFEEIRSPLTSHLHS